MYYFKYLRLVISLAKLIYFVTLSLLLSIICFVLWVYFGFSEIKPAFEICILSYLLVFSPQIKNIGYFYGVIFDIMMLYPTGITSVSFLFISCVLDYFKDNFLSNMQKEFINSIKLIFSVILLSVLQYIFLSIFSYPTSFLVLIKQILLTILMFLLLFPVLKVIFGKNRH